MSTQPNLNVLIVEDDLDLANMIGLFLKSKGHRAAIANIAEYALDLLEDQEFDLIILDIILPEMDGYELLKAMKDRHGIAPGKVIMMSGLQDQSEIKRARQAGVQTYLTKPFAMDDFLSAVEGHASKISGPQSGEDPEKPQDPGHSSASAQ